MRVGGSRPNRAQGEGALAQGVEHPQFFGEVEGGERVAEGAFAREDLLEVEGHGVSVRNCRANFCQASVS